MTMTPVSNDELRYNEVRQKSVHNTFQRNEGIADQFLYWRVRSMEIDVHHADVFGNTTAGDWSVHHDWYDPISTVSHLSQHLKMMRKLNSLVPRHEVCTLFIDIKDPFPAWASARHGWKAFDALLTKHLGARLYRPEQLVRRARGATSLRDALDRKGWPTLRELRGKFIVVLTGSPTQLANYATSSAAALKRAAFLSAPVDSGRDIPGPGDQIFYNINGEKNMSLVKRVHPHGFVARSYYLNTEQLWKDATAADCHHLATDKVNERVDRWSSTQNTTGFPFDRLGGGAIDSAIEQGAAWGLWARSGDIWSDHDSFHFNYRRCTPSKMHNTYEFAIAGANSHIDQYVKGAVLARVGLNPDDPYFGVFRLGEKHGLRVQFRPQAGGPTMVTSAEIGPVGLFGRDVDQDTIVHVRLKIDRAGKRARAWGSYDGRTWSLLGRYEFNKPLRYQGIGVSSHGENRGAKFLFVPTRRTAGNPFDENKLIGGEADHAGWTDTDGTGRWLTQRFSGWKPPRRTNRRA